MDYNSLKQIGKVTDFDGEAGSIVTPDQEYLFYLSEVKEPISPNELVSFYPDNIKFGNEIFPLARNITPLQKSNIKTLQKDLRTNTNNS